MKRYLVEVQEGEAGEQILPLPEELLNEAGWKEGDKLNWKDNLDGTYTLTKIPSAPRKLVLVETVSTFRCRYVVEVPEGKLSWAEDTVVSEEAQEFSQKHLEETIISSRHITEDEMKKLWKDDNEYLLDWSTEKIFDGCITQIDDNGNIIKK